MSNTIQHGSDEYTQITYVLKKASTDNGKTRLGFVPIRDYGNAANVVEEPRRREYALYLVNTIDSDELAVLIDMLQACIDQETDISLIKRDLMYGQGVRVQNLARKAALGDAGKETMIKNGWQYLTAEEKSSWETAQALAIQRYKEHNQTDNDADHVWFELL